MMKIIFAGTAEFALPALTALITAKHNICGVYTQPDRPAGRGRKLTATPVKHLAYTHNLPLYQPLSLKDPSTQKELQELHADILVNVAYGLLVPEAILKLPRFGCINIHPSLLPRWRGAAPIQRAIMSGDTTTGVTIMKMDAGLDTGDIYKQLSLPIEPTDTTATLMHKASELGANLLLEVLAEIEQGKASMIPQNHQYTTYASKISKTEGKINWQHQAYEIERMIRAFNPWPIAYTEIAGTYLRIWQATINPKYQPHAFKASPGTIIHLDDNSIDVATGAGVLSLLKIQFAGSRPLPIKDILNADQQLFTLNTRFTS